MKAFRWSFYTLMAVCLAQGLATGIRAYYLVFFVQVFLLATSVFLNLWTAFSFAYLQSTDDKRAVKGDAGALHIGIFNDKPFPFTMMRVHIGAVSEKDGVDISFSLMPNSSINFDLPFSLPYRGEFRIGMTYLEITDIFGLVRMKFDMRRLSYYMQKDLLVYPRLVILPKLKAAPGDTKHFNALNIKASDEGDAFAGARQYQKGDGAKRIHWKMSMRRREIYSKQFEIPMESQSLVFIHNIPREPGEPSLLYADTACECATAICRHFLASDHPVTVIETGSRQMSISAASLNGFQTLYDWLARLPFQENGSLEMCVDARIRKTNGIQAVYLIAPGVDESLIHAANLALSTGRPVSCIIIDGDAGSKLRAPGAVREIDIRSGQDIAEVLGGVL